MSRWHLDWYQDWHLDWFGPDDAEAALFPGYGTSGPVLPVLLENGYTVTLNYRTDVIKAASGVETSRTALLDGPKESYAGAAKLRGDVPVEVRTMLAEYAASGGQFLLPLPHEETTCTLSGAVATVPTTLDLDWINEGQRVVVVNDEEFVPCVVQSSTATTITLDRSPGLSGQTRMMPVRQVLLEPQQELPRYPTEAEIWSLQARAAIFGFAPEFATLALGPLTDSAGFDSATVTARTFGDAPTLAFQLAPATGIQEIGQAVTILFQTAGTPTTVEDVYALLQSSTLLNPTGTWGTGNMSASDAFAATELTGGDVSGPVGRSASVTTYDSLPVWDYSIAIEDTNADGVHAMTQIVDFGAVPYAIGESDQPDWYRAVRIEGGTHADWQWLKLFLATVKGRQGSFYLPTWRADLGYVSHVGAAVTVTGSIAKWWPRHREHVQIQQADGTLTYAEILSVAGQVITLSESLSASAITMISWLELCRFEQDEFQVVFGEQGFSLDTVARVHRPGEVFPTVYELITIARSDGVTYYHTSAPHDVVYASQRYTAIPLERSEAAVTMPGEEKELTLTLPVDHALARRWVQQASPPKTVTVTIAKLTDGVGSQIWVGDITAMATERKVAKFNVPSRAGAWMLRSTPSALVARSCPHFLYDSMCGVSRTGSHDGLAHRVTTTVISVAGRNITVDLGSTSRNGTWAENGEVTHASTTEIKAVVKQTDQNPGSSGVATLQLDSVIVGLKAGDSVTIDAGCDWTLPTCHDRFGNRQSYGGMYQLRTSNPFRSGSGGIKGSV